MRQRNFSFRLLLGLFLLFVSIGIISPFVLSAMSVVTNPSIISIIDQVTIPAGGNAMGPQGGLDLSGFTEYRLVLRLDGPAGTRFVINELYGPCASISQLNNDIYSGTIPTGGVINLRLKQDIFAPKYFFLRVINYGSAPIKASCGIYVAK